MIRRTTAPILVLYSIYLAAIAMTTALLVFWVLVVQRFTPEINQLISRVGVETNKFHWFIQTSGAGLFFLVILALTYLLAVTLSERKYSSKQEQFLSNITHELKTPVAAIRLHAQTIQQGDIPAADRQRFVGYIVREADRISSLVDNMLEGSRLLSGKSHSDLEPVELRRFFEQYQENVDARFDLRDLQLEFDIQTNAVVLATEESLIRILDNLIGNAIRYTKEGGVISCRVRATVGEAEIVVADNGVGIPKGELKRIFERFHRLRRELRDDLRDGGRQGTGLGLAIVRGLVEEMRGRIRAISNEEQPGTRFEIVLPTTSPHGARTGERLHVSDSGSARSSSTPKSSSSTHERESR